MKKAAAFLLLLIAFATARGAYATGITFSFANGEIVGDVYQFDVMVQASTAGTKIRDASVYLRYNAAAFGTNIATTGGLTIVKGSLIAHDAYMLQTNNNSLNIFVVTIEGDATNAQPLPTTPTPLLTVQMQIVDGPQTTGLSFDAVLMSDNQYQHDRTLYTPITATDTDDSMLPVELSSFDARLDEGAARLLWTTASETNNAGFEIEQASGSDSAAFAPVGYVAGQGTTTNPTRYQFSTARLTPGRHWFRLKQIDYDGTFAYSPVVELSVELAESFELSDAYPNPFNPQTTFTLALRQSQHVSVAVYNTVGQRVSVLHDGPLAGNGTHRFTFDAAGLSSGNYFIRIQAEHFTAVRRASLVK